MINTDLENAKNIYLGSTEVSALYIGNNLMWELNTGLLPKGYTLLEYISSTSDGGLYIDLNIMLYDTLNKDYDIAIKFNIHGPGKDNQQSFLFFCLNVTNPWPGTFIRLTEANDTYVTGRYIGGTAKDNKFTNINTICELPVLTPPNKNITNLSNSGQTHSFGTSLFCGFSDANNTPYRFVNADLYYFKLFVEGILVRDMIPCIDSNNVVGLYDLVNDVFYSSPNGAAFIAGPEI